MKGLCTRTLKLFSAFLWIALFRCDVAAASSSFALLSPPNQAIFGGAGLIHLIVELNQPTNLSVRLNGKPLANVKIADKVQHYPLRLKFGLNRIEVGVMEQGRLLEQESRELFFFSPIAEEKEIPPGFASRPFHRVDGKNGEQCRGCHLLESPKEDLAPATPKDSSCYICHKGLNQFRQVHGPASLWNCLGCHNSKSAPAKYATPTPVRDLCFGCHTDLKNYFFSSQYQHGPTATGMCTICHNPHASDNEFWLKKPPWDLCTTSHAEKASGRHIIAWGPSGDSHPTRGRPDPMKPEREFSCRSCHNPHASNAPKLWNFNATTAYQLCWTCHRK